MQTFLSQQSANNKYTLYACYLAAIVVLMDLSSINIALPSISKHFNFNMTQVSWLLIISMLSASSFALITGKIIEVFGTKRVLVLGFIIFFIGTFSCFISKQFNILLIIRFFQGIGESFLYVSGPAFIRKSLHSNKQQTAYGVWMACTGIGIGIGPVIGGFLISSLSWNWVFLINFPLSIFGILLMIKVKPSFILKKTNSQTDYLGALYSFLFLSCLIYGLNTMSRFESNFTLIYFAIIFSAIFFILFIKREKKFINPVFDLKLFSTRNFSLTIIGFFLYFIVNVGSRFIRPFYFEEIRMLSTEMSGVLMMISPQIMILISPLTRKLCTKIHPNKICIIGNALLAISMFICASWNTDTHLWVLILAMVILGIGMGLYYPTSSYVGMTSLQKNNSGMGSAAISTSKSMGKLMGILLFSSFFSLFNQLLPEQNAINLIFAFNMTFLSGGIIAIIAIIISLYLKK